MYDGYKTVNYFVGCNFDCIYCEKSFKRQMKRRKNVCGNCYAYLPHFHLERLYRPLPRKELIFLNAMGDCSFAGTEGMHQIIDKVESNPRHTFLMQSKNPATFKRFENLPENLIVGTTIETNRSELTSQVSRAPSPVERYIGLREVEHFRKFWTMEPALDFDIETIIRWVSCLQPEVFWIGYCNHIELANEPPLEKVHELIDRLKVITDVRTKNMRGPKVEE
jgi:hypothetical protein